MNDLGSLEINKIDKSCPKVARILSERLSVADFALIERAYEWVISNGGIEHIGVVRKKGASFNPQPARICELLALEGSVSNGLVFAAGMLSSVRHSDICRSELPADVVELAQLAVNYPNYLTQYPDHSPQIIFLAAQLDRIRHLHMTEIPFPYQQNIIKEIRGTLGKREIAQQCARLHTLLLTAINFFERRTRN